MQKTSQQTTKDMRSALHRLGEARKSFQMTKLACVSFQDQWSKYVSAATDRWNGFINQLHEQDTALAKDQDDAVQALKSARQQLEMIKELMHSSDKHFLVESDDEASPATQKICRTLLLGITNMARSLEQLGQTANESLEQLQDSSGIVPTEIHQLLRKI